MSDEVARGQLVSLDRQNRWEISSLEKNYKVTYHELMSRIWPLNTFHFAIDHMSCFNALSTCE